MIPVARFGFPRPYRLLNQNQFARVLNGRCRVGNESFTVYALQNEYNHPRLGLVVGKKIARKAVDRNRIKRTIREAFRHQAPAISKLDLVIFAKATAANQPASKLNQQLNTLLSRVDEKCAQSSSD